MLALRGWVLTLRPARGGSADNEHLGRGLRSFAPVWLWFSSF